MEILDTTLREGEQTPGVTFSINEKIIIARLLDEFGVDIIEAGHPKVSADVFQAVKEISNLGLNAEILAHCRALKEDIDCALLCDVDWVGIFYSISDERMKTHLKTNLLKAKEKIVETIQYAKDHGLKVRYTPEDSVRTDYESLLFVCKETITAGANRISIADTVGAMSPSKMYELFLNLKKDLNIELNVHCHNDLGLAVANSLAAYEGGASLIDVTVNGLGERAGISGISEICIALDTIYKEKNKWNFEKIPEISNTVSRFSGINIPPNAPVVGENVFIHNAGLHVAAVLANPSFYEVFPAELIGRKRTFVLDKMASVHTIKQKLKQVGVPLCKKNISKAYNYAKLKEKGTISNDELLTLFIEEDPKNIIYQ